MKLRANEMKLGAAAISIRMEASLRDGVGSMRR